jgi:hypothetical protein
VHRLIFALFSIRLPNYFAMTIGSVFLSTAHKRLAYYKELGDKTFAQLNDTDFYFQPDEESNSMAMLIRHMAGNMLSRWSNFLNEDGEKPWRNRDDEFAQSKAPKADLLAYWEQGWQCCLGAIGALTEADLLKTITIRGEALIVVDAINRQLAHYPYHVGQIVALGKLIRKEAWQNLSIPRGGSQAYNDQMQQK